MTESLKVRRSESTAPVMGDVQILRAVAVLSVFVFHLSATNQFFSWLQERHHGIENPFEVGVDLFFVISGFVVSISFRRKRYSVNLFIQHRLVRIWPILPAFVMVVLAVNTVASMAHTSAFMVNDRVVSSWMLLKQGLRVISGTTVSPAGYSDMSFQYGTVWSLSVEIQFYFAMAIFVLLLGVLRVTITHIRRAIMVASSLGLLVFTALYAINTFPTLGDSGFAWYCLRMRVPCLLAGILLSEVTAHWKVSPSINPFLTVIAFLLALIALSLDYQSRFSAGGVVKLVLLSLIVANAGSGTAFPYITGVARRTMYLVADRSYAIYLFHLPMFLLSDVIMAEMLPLTINNGQRYAFAQIVLGLPLTFLVSDLAHRWVERPALSFRKVR